MSIERSVQTIVTKPRKKCKNYVIHTSLIHKWIVLYILLNNTVRDATKSSLLDIRAILYPCACAVQKKHRPESSVNINLIL